MACEQPLPLADEIAGVPGRASVHRAAPTGRGLHDLRGGPHPPELGDTGTSVVACVARDGEAGVKGLGVGEWEPSGKAAQELYQLARARSSASYGADSFLATAVIGNKCSYIN